MNISLLKARKMLLDSQRPFFLYDNDADGFCSFVLLRRMLDRGDGLVVRSYPGIDSKYVSKAKESADLVVVLDRHTLGPDFDSDCKTLWVDHHPIQETNVFYYNSLFDKPRPTSAICYDISKKNEWIALMGCVSDNYLPVFGKKYGKTAFDIYFSTELGRVARAINFCLKGDSNILKKLEKFFLSAGSIEEAIAEVDGGELGKFYGNLAERYSEVYKKAEVIGDLVFLSYSGEIGFSAELANELSYRNNGKYIVVVNSGGMCKISMRGKNVKKVFEKIVKAFPGLSGGGHDDAIGARLPLSDLRAFKERLKKEVG